MRFFTLFLLLSFFASCTESIPKEGDTSSIKEEGTTTDNTTALTNTSIVNLSDSLTLLLGKEVVLEKEGISLLLREVSSDNRCPQQVNCIMAGDVKAMLLVKKGDQEETVSLVAKGLCKEDKGACGNKTKALGYAIRLINIYPYPVAKTPKTFDGYSAKILMNKNIE